MDLCQRRRGGLGKLVQLVQEGRQVVSLMVTALRDLSRIQQQHAVALSTLCKSNAAHLRGDAGLLSSFFGSKDKKSSTSFNNVPCISESWGSLIKCIDNYARDTAEASQCVLDEAATSLKQFLDQSFKEYKQAATQARTAEQQYEAAVRGVNMDDPTSVGKLRACYAAINGDEMTRCLSVLYEQEKNRANAVREALQRVRLSSGDLSPLLASMPNITEGVCANNLIQSVLEMCPDTLDSVEESTRGDVDEGEEPVAARGEGTMCSCCLVSFSFWKRRHECSRCKAFVCGEKTCSDKYLFTKLAWSEQRRLCNRCVVLVKDEVHQLERRQRRKSLPPARSWANKRNSSPPSPSTPVEAPAAAPKPKPKPKPKPTNNSKKSRRRKSMPPGQIKPILEEQSPQGQKKQQRVKQPPRKQRPPKNQLKRQPAKKKRPRKKGPAHKGSLRKAPPKKGAVKWKAKQSSPARAKRGQTLRGSRRPLPRGPPKTNRLRRTKSVTHLGKKKLPPSQQGASPGKGERGKTRPVPPAPHSGDARAARMSAVASLVELAKHNDYYTLFQVERNATNKEIAAARRKITKELHPDKFQNGSKEEKEATEKLSVINMVYASVLKNNREDYNKLVNYRVYYTQLLAVDAKMLQKACDNMYLLQKAFKEKRLPLVLVHELDEALSMMRKFRQVTPMRDDKRKQSTSKSARKRN